MLSALKTGLRNNREFIAVSFAFWALLIIRFGYTFGTEDHIEFLPYTLYMADSKLYANDFFIRELASYPINERIFFCGLLSPFKNCLEIICLFGHLFSVSFLVFSIIKIQSIFIRSHIWNYASVFVLMILFMGWFPGGSGIYTNNFAPDIPAHALGAFGLYLILKDKIIPAAILFIIATLLHPLTGLYIDVLGFGAYFFFNLTTKQNQSLLKLFFAFGIYVLTAGVYMYILKGERSPVLSKEAFFDLFFRFRYPHHTMPSYFPLKNIIATAILSVLAVLFFYRKNKLLFCFIVLQLFGFIFYTVAVEIFQVVEIGLTQWFRSSVWIVMFGLTALFGFIDERFPIDIKSKSISIYSPVLFFAAVFLVLVINPALFPLNKPYEIGSYKFGNKEIEIANIVREKNLAGTYILPFNFNAFKYYARQDSYVDYKASPRKNASLAEWYRRVQLIYGIHTANKTQGFKVENEAKSFYQKIDANRISALKNEGVTHILTDTIMNQALLKPVANNGIYYVYAIR